MGIYENYYACKHEPFNLGPDPRFLYLAPSHREALAQLRYMVETRKGFLVLTGEVGTGKTTLLRKLLQEIDKNVRVAYISNPPLSVSELYSILGQELGFHVNGAQRPIYVLNQYLQECFGRGETVLVIFDEAQRLTPEVLEEIRLLSNIETPSEKLLQVIFAGQPEFSAILEQDTLRALRQRVVLRYSLTPLTFSETVEYIATRLNVAGAPNSPFTLRACKAVYRYSGGIPRLINLICDNALLLGYACDKRYLDVSDIETVARDLKLTPISSNSRRDVLPKGPSEKNYPRKAWRFAALTLLAAPLLVAVAIVHRYDVPIWHDVSLLFNDVTAQLKSFFQRPDQPQKSAGEGEQPMTPREP